MRAIAEAEAASRGRIGGGSGGDIAVATAVMAVDRGGQMTEEDHATRSRGLWSCRDPEKVVRARCDCKEAATLGGGVGCDVAVMTAVMLG